MMPSSKASAVNFSVKYRPPRPSYFITINRFAAWNSQDGCLVPKAESLKSHYGGLDGAHVPCLSPLVELVADISVNRECSYKNILLAPDIIRCFKTTSFRRPTLFSDFYSAPLGFLKDWILTQNSIDESL